MLCKWDLSDDSTVLHPDFSDNLYGTHYAHSLHQGQLPGLILHYNYVQGQHEEPGGRDTGTHCTNFATSCESINILK